METRLKLIPGQRGTKKLVQVYGDQLICVRYRYDEARKRRYKTVELIVDEIPWIAKKKSSKQAGSYKEERIVAVQVDYAEKHIRTIVKNAGGKWNSEDKVWSLSYRKAVEIGLEKRIVS